MRSVLLSMAATMFLFAGCNQNQDPKTEANKDSTVSKTFNPEMEPVGGQPSFDSKPSVADLNYQVKYQRAFEAVLWSMPATAIYSFRRSAFEDLSYKDNNIIAYFSTATPKLEALTANSTTPYIAAYADLTKGPVVLQIPVAGTEGSLYGQVVDAWQFSIADVGPSGLDKGKAGKYLFIYQGFRLPDLELVN